MSKLWFQAYHLGEGRVLKTIEIMAVERRLAYHLGEGRVLKTSRVVMMSVFSAYHLGEGRVLKTFVNTSYPSSSAYHLGEGRVLKTSSITCACSRKAYHLGEGRVLRATIAQKALQEQCQLKLLICSTGGAIILSRPIYLRISKNFFPYYFRAKFRCKRSDCRKSNPLSI